jgi:O-antigen/teichoic acid export membrane protein
MYLDHVTDAMLKGVGEQVYSMWVNISDSLLSVFLIWILLPKMGISGYAVVIIVMEGYNFLLSFFRLKKRVKFSIKTLFSFALPLLEALLSALVSDSIFEFSGKLTSPILLVAKIVFAVCLFLALNLLENLIFNKNGHPCNEKAPIVR